MRREPGSANDTPELGNPARHAAESLTHTGCMPCLRAGYASELLSFLVLVVRRRAVGGEFVRLSTGGPWLTLLTIPA